jgi:heat shock protein 4
MEKRVRVKKTPLTVAATGVAGHDSKSLLDLIEAEGSMAANDKLQEDTNEAKNALEAYIYGLRSKLYEKLAPFVQEVGCNLGGAAGKGVWVQRAGAARACMLPRV